MATSRIEVPLLALIKRHDPNFFRDRARATEYQTSNGRVFTADPTKRGAYADTRGPEDFFSEGTTDVGAVTDVFHD